jgi:hypothetical protein|tara:strand:+ start:18137 stop:19489 length:1353 start_codon:yes stop_codon:yes gene_type:complete
MPGGLIQLVAYGSQNVYLNGNPSVSFFKKVYKTHTNFSAESMKVVFNKNEINYNQSTILIAKIARNADLVQEVYFSFKIPDIKKKNNNANERENFQFVKYLGEVMIENYKIYIGGTLMDTQYGEWLHIWNELSIESSKKYGYDKLIGNIPELYMPDIYNNLNMNEIQIDSRRLYVPLKFWFNKNPGLALPLIALQYHEIEIHIEIRPLKELIKINNVAPLNKDVVMKYFNDTDKLNIEPYLEVNYVFLDTVERNYIAVNSHDYLIEQVVRISFDSVQENAVNTLVLQNPVKEIIWVLNRNDVNTTNEWFDYTDNQTIQSVYEDESGCRCSVERQKEKEILKSATFLFNGIERIEEKDGSYFNLIQPYQHHSVVPSPGIYVYSFSLLPEQFQPSGACNMSRINNIELRTSIISPQEPPTGETTYKYDMRVYIVNYNFLRVQGGLGGLAFSC